MATLADRITRLEREAREARAELAAAPAWNTERYLAHVLGQLEDLRRRKVAHTAKLAAISKQAHAVRRLYRDPIAGRGGVTARALPVPVGHFALTLPASYQPAHVDDVELVPTWTGAMWRTA